MLTRREWYLAIISGILMALSYAPLPTAPLAWIGLVPLILALEGTSPRQALRLGGAFGLSYNLGVLYWIAFHTEISTPLSIAAWIGAGCIMTLYAIPAAWAVRVGSHWTGKWWVWTLPFTWVGAEYLRYVTELAFPWTTIAHTQARLLGIVQQADIWGVLGVSFWLVIMNILAYHAYKTAFSDQRRAWRWAAAFVLLLSVTFTYGRYRLNEQPTQPPLLTVGIVQPSIPMSVKWGRGGLEVSQEAYVDQSLDIEPGSVDLVIWPETALPDYTIYNPPGTEFDRIVNARYRHMFRTVMEHTGVPLVIGTPAYDYRIKDAFNTGAIVMPESLTVETYEKRFLVPFGERIPYASVFGWLNWFDFGIATWKAGERNVLLSTGSTKFGMAVCLESVFPGVFRDFVRQGAEFHVVLTNDAWFGNTSSPYQHAEFAVFRAIETRSWIVRAANTGISGIYDPWGRMVTKGPLFEPALIVGSVARPERATPYLHFGDWIAWLSIVVTIALTIGGWLASRRTKQ
jgi:apolipoprotein N-acyltransferase